MSYIPEGVECSLEMHTLEEVDTFNSSYITSIIRLSCGCSHIYHW